MPDADVTEGIEHTFIAEDAIGQREFLDDFGHMVRHGFRSSYLAATPLLAYGDGHDDSCPPARCYQLPCENGSLKACMTARSLDISIRVNGEGISATVEARKTLVDFLRDDLALTGTHIGCEHGVCGACTVRLDGAVVRGCLVLAVQCDGAEVETIEGLSDSGVLADLQLAFQQRNALQCGYCTPGMLIGAHELLSRGGVPSRDTIREHLSGNYCRCTGYQAIVDAIEVGGAGSREKGKLTMNEHAQPPTRPSAPTSWKKR